MGLVEGGERSGLRWEIPPEPKGPDDGGGAVLQPAPSTWLVHFKKNVHRPKQPSCRCLPCRRSHPYWYFEGISFFP